MNLAFYWLIYFINEFQQNINKLVQLFITKTTHFTRGGL